MIDAWIDKIGKIHTGDDHQLIARKLFPKSDNPELSCEKSDYIKIGTMWNGSPMMSGFSREYSTQAQINSVEKVWEDHYKFKRQSID